ncbi:anti-sigma-F factor Fin [Psychrobacillus sp. NPDC058041]|uniref:anti-sigma-F factor Fin n=1 Tax=Psychrobacillus sp. NPDC058041 TaxID=3346310 RepID=UPI0036DB8837
MTIRYKCRHCETEIGQLPLDSIDEQFLQKNNITPEEQDLYIMHGVEGDYTVQCICEDCQSSLQKFPNYYALKKWIQ